MSGFPDLPTDEHDPLPEILQRLRAVRDGNSSIYQMKPAEAFEDIVEALEVIAKELKMRGMK
jgi:hypothetical protein